MVGLGSRASQARGRSPVRPRAIHPSNVSEKVRSGSPVSTFVPFPRTPYLLPPPGLDLRADKVLSDAQRDRLLHNPLHVEEKVDGQNLGISFGDFEPLFQSRGGYVELGGADFRGLDAWFRPRQRRLRQALGSRLVVFGEWCSDVHSIFYDRLPDWFLVFDVFDRDADAFWTCELRDEIAAELGLSVVPHLSSGQFDLNSLAGLIGQSRVGASRMEGIVLRAEDDRSVIDRAKIVRSDFTQSIGEHWRSAERRKNRLQVA